MHTRSVRTLAAAAALAVLLVPTASAGFASAPLVEVRALFTNAGRVSEVCFVSIVESEEFPERNDCVATKLGRLSDAKVVKDGIATHTSIITSGGSAVGPIPFLYDSQLIYVLALQDIIEIGGVNVAISCFAIFAESYERNGLQTLETPGAHGLWGDYTQDWLLYSTCPRILDTWFPPVY